MYVSVYRRRQQYFESKSVLQRAIFLLLLCSGTILDLKYSVLVRFLNLQQSFSVLLFLLETILSVFSLTNLICLGWRWMSPLYSTPLQLSDKQFRLLRLQQETPGFARSPEKEEKYPNPFTPLPGSLISSPKPSEPSPASPAQSSTPVNTSVTSWLSSSGNSPSSQVYTSF